MKTAKIYFEGKEVCKTNYSKLRYDEILKVVQVLGDNNEIVGSIPFGYMILIEHKENLTVTVKGSDLVDILNNRPNRNSI